MARPTSTPSQSAKLAPSSTAKAPDYGYVRKELRIIGILTAALLVVTFVLAVVLR